MFEVSVVHVVGTRALQLNIRIRRPALAAAIKQTNNFRRQIILHTASCFSLAFTVTDLQLNAMSTGVVT